ncbi:hypothetical protein [Bacillus sp. FJAT-45037]|uniref:hypothetical protein n=1 Tax=Bacillus sp. FJAT-45037 TaxID=2011007 RepID=UPI000C2310B8|nr:hypothetical protein [Bacillus sp. FJAT-45037]
MKKRHIVFILTQLVVLLVVAGQPLVERVSAEEDIHATECGCNHAEDKNKHFHESIRVHKDFYMELLTEKYTPEQVEQWKAIRSERDLLLKKLNEAKKRGEIMHGDIRSKEWTDHHHELQKQLTKAVKERNDQEITELLPLIFAHYEKLNTEFQDRVKALNDADVNND